MGPIWAEIAPQSAVPRSWVPDPCGPAWPSAPGHPLARTPSPALSSTSNGYLRPSPSPYCILPRSSGPPALSGSSSRTSAAPLRGPRPRPPNLCSSPVSAQPSVPPPSPGVGPDRLPPASPATNPVRCSPPPGQAGSLRPAEVGTYQQRPRSDGGRLRTCTPPEAQGYPAGAGGGAREAALCPSSRSVVWPRPCRVPCPSPRCAPRSPSLPGCTSTVAPVPAKSWGSPTS